MSDIFSIEYSRLVRQLLPRRHRKAREISWLNALIAPVIWIYGLLTTQRAKSLYDLRHNGQVCKLEAVLNDSFESAPYIYISDFLFGVYLFVYLTEELYPVLPLYPSGDGPPLYLYTVPEIGYSGKFIVNVPDFLVYDPVLMNSLIVKYKLAGMGYLIKTYST